VQHRLASAPSLHIDLCTSIHEDLWGHGVTFKSRVAGSGWTGIKWSVHTRTDTHDARMGLRPEIGDTACGACFRGYRISHPHAANRQHMPIQDGMSGSVLRALESGNHLVCIRKRIYCHPPCSAAADCTEQQNNARTRNRSYSHVFNNLKSRTDRTDQWSAVSFWGFVLLWLPPPFRTRLPDRTPSKDSPHGPISESLLASLPMNTHEKEGNMVHK